MRAVLIFNTRISMGSGKSLWPRVLGLFSAVSTVCVGSFGSQALKVHVPSQLGEFGKYVATHSQLCVCVHWW